MLLPHQPHHRHRSQHRSDSLPEKYLKIAVLLVVNTIFCLLIGCCKVLEGIFQEGVLNQLQTDCIRYSSCALQNNIESYERCQNLEYLGRVVSVYLLILLPVIMFSARPQH